MERRSNCRFCDNQSHGYGCPYSTDGLHEEVGDAEHCIRCGSTNYGDGCVFPNRSSNSRGIHIHGHGTDNDGNTRCIYCGKVMTYKNGSKGVSGHGCPFSPSGKHQA